MKTNPYGVRFKQEQLDLIKKEKGIATPQKCVNYLFDFWEENRNVKFDLFKKIENLHIVISGIVSPNECVSPLKSDGLIISSESNDIVTDNVIIEEVTIPSIEEDFDEDIEDDKCYDYYYKKVAEYKQDQTITPYEREELAKEIQSSKILDKKQRDFLINSLK